MPGSQPCSCHDSLHRGEPLFCRMDTAPWPPHCGCQDPVGTGREVLWGQKHGPCHVAAAVKHGWRQNGDRMAKLVPTGAAGRMLTRGLSGGLRVGVLSVFPGELEEVLTQSPHLPPFPQSLPGSCHGAKPAHTVVLLGQSTGSSNGEHGSPVAVACRL